MVMVLRHITEALGSTVIPTHWRTATQRAKANISIATLPYGRRLPIEGRNFRLKRPCDSANPSPSWKVSMSAASAPSLVAAIYARKSTDQVGIAEEHRSVQRQVDHAREWIRNRGWVVAEDYVFVDDGVSGAEFDTRPGFLRLMNALKPRPAFEVLVMSEESRLGRETISTAYALKQIITAGVRVFFYLEGTERTLDSPMDKVMLSVTSFAAEFERDKARQRVTDAMVRKARNGYWCGGYVYGYDRVEQLGAPDAVGQRIRQFVRLQINPEEAANVVRVFELCARGLGLRRIAKCLNAEGAVAPRPKRGRHRGWAPSTIGEILRRPLYRGEYVWNRSQKRDKWGLKRYRVRPESEWIRVAMPELRVVSEEQWQAAHERLSTSRQNYLRHNDGKVWGRPANGVESKHLLIGMAVCAECGAGLMVRSRRYGSRHGHFYTCSANWRRGSCDNRLEIPAEMAEAAVLESVESELLTPAVIENAIESLFVQASAPASELADRRACLQTALRTVETELQRLTSAVIEGGPLATLTTALKEREQHREHLEGELRRLDRLPRRESLEDVNAEALRHLDQWRGLLGQNTSIARQLLRKVLNGRLAFTPRSDGVEAWYEFAAKGTLEKFFEGVPAIKAVVPLRSRISNPNSLGNQSVSGLKRCSESQQHEALGGGNGSARAGVV